MKLETFYKIFYKHRFVKANLIKKIYIIFFLPINYLLNIFFLEPKINLDNFSIKNKEFFDKNLNFLFENFNSDKGENYINQYQKPIKRTKEKSAAHKYHQFYEEYFYKLKNKKIDIFEIGAFKGNASAAFYFYFKSANIFSGDIFPDLFRYKSKRIKNFFLDNSNEKELNDKIVKTNLKFDIIIEDAGHYLKDQIISLFILFRSLKNSGIFVIEELDFPDIRHDMNILNERPTLRDILINIQEKKDFHSKYIKEEDKKYFLDHFKDIKIFKGRFNEIVFIRKK